MTGPVPKGPPTTSQRFTLGTLLLLLAFTGRLHAHDPGLSTATIQLKSKSLEVELIFSFADAGQISGLSTNGEQLPIESMPSTGTLPKRMSPT